MAASEEKIFGTKLVGGAEILLGYDDFVRLFDITNMGFAPGLELRTNGVFVVPPPDDLYVPPEERATLTAHPTGNLSEPALSLPCKLSALEAFADFFGLRAAIDPFTMMQVTNRLTWAYLQDEARIEQGFHSEFFPISGLSNLRRKLRSQHEREANSDKWKVQREVLDGLDDLLSPIDNAQDDLASSGEPTLNTASGPDGNKPLFPKREKTLLRIIRALDALAELPDRGAAAEVVAKLQGLQFQSPGDDTVRDVLAQARNLEVD